MITREGSAFAIFLPVAVFVILSLGLTATSVAQGVQVDLSSTSDLCGGSQCFNVAGLFTTGTKFLGTTGMDNGNNCTPTPPYTNCPDAYSSNQLGLSSATPPTLTPPSLNVPFTFGTVNTSNCGPSTSTSCIVNIVNFTSGGVNITLPSSPQNIFSTMIILGTSLNGSHSGTIVATYTQGTPDTFTQTFSDWCGFSGGTAIQNGTSIGTTESIAVGDIKRINADGTLNGASCNLYAYTLPLDVTRVLQGITLQDSAGTGTIFALAITLKPPSYTITGGVANPTSVAAGSTSTATVTVNPQTGYTTATPSKTVNLSCSISPTIVGVPPSATTAPTCSLNPTSVTVTQGETAPPTTTLTFTAASPAKASLTMRSNSIYAFWMIPGLTLTGLGLGSRGSRRNRLFGLLLIGLLLAGITATPACVSYKHLGNVGTPPGQYTIAITGVDENGLTQASNPAGTTNTVVLTVTQ
jgi:hypothetical protein